MTKSKRYNLVIPNELFDEVQRIASERHTTVVDILKQFIRIGLFIEKSNKTSDYSIVIKHGNKEEGIYIL